MGWRGLQELGRAQDHAADRPARARRQRDSARCRHGFAQGPAAVPAAVAGRGRARLDGPPDQHHRRPGAGGARRGALALERRSLLPQSLRRPLRPRVARAADQEASLVGSARLRLAAAAGRQRRRQGPGQRRAQRAGLGPQGRQDGPLRSPPLPLLHQPLAGLRHTARGVLRQRARGAGAAAARQARAATLLRARHAPILGGRGQAPPPARGGCVGRPPRVLQPARGPALRTHAHPRRVAPTAGRGRTRALPRAEGLLEHHRRPRGPPCVAGALCADQLPDAAHPRRSGRRLGAWAQAGVAPPRMRLRPGALPPPGQVGRRLRAAAPHLPLPTRLRL
mmetsp:Transcript_22512/g.57139  ORF Transcript_22512/g.57139 Transcript_22512/m.57139 type:complete len:337 (+) Transcript_22512:280-1290(+)